MRLCLIAYHIVLRLGRALKNKTKQNITEWALCDTQNSYTRTLAPVLCAYIYATTRPYVNIIIISTVFPKMIRVNLGFNFTIFVKRYIFRSRLVSTGRLGVARNDVDEAFANQRETFKKDLNLFVLKTFRTHTIISRFSELYAQISIFGYLFEIRPCRVVFTFLPIVLRTPDFEPYTLLHANFAVLFSIIFVYVCCLNDVRVTSPTSLLLCRDCRELSIFTRLQKLDLGVLIF